MPAEPAARDQSRSADPSARVLGTAVGRIHRLSSEENKQLVRRLVDQAVAQHDLDLLDELAAGEFAEVAKRWVRPFQSAFPDFEMRVVELIAEWRPPASDPWFIIGISLIIVVSAAFCVWAFRLLETIGPAVNRPSNS